MSILDVYVSVDEFWQQFAPQWERHLLTNGQQRRRATRLSMSELLTIVIWFHCSHYRTFKAYYTEYVQVHLRAEFPQLVSYPRMVALLPRLAVPLMCYMATHRGRCTGLSFVDSTPLAVCHPARIAQHHVFKGVAQRGKTSVGWFYGFKLHVIVNDQGELLSWALSAGNVNDRAPLAQLLDQIQPLVGALIGDKGYLSQALAVQVWDDFGVHLLTRKRKNMRPTVQDTAEQAWLLRKRALIETIFDQLKNISQIEHSRHRNATHFLVHLVAGLIAYSFQPKKPGLHLERLALCVA